MRPQVVLSRLDAEDAKMVRWLNVMAHHGGVGSKIVYRSVFFCWL